MAKELIYYPNPEIIKAPLFELNSLDEMPVSPKYALTCNGKSRIVYCTDFFHTRRWWWMKQTVWMWRSLYQKAFRR